MESPGVTVTATPFRRGQYLVVQRSWDDANLPGYWAFPGGRVQCHDMVQIHSMRDSTTSVVSETLVEAVVREVREETGLDCSRLFMVDSYQLGKRPGLHFCAEVEDGDVVLQEGELVDFRWVSTIEELAELRPLIPGLLNHVVEIESRFAECGEFAWVSIGRMNLLPSSYINT